MHVYKRGCFLIVARRNDAGEWGTLTARLNRANDDGDDQKNKRWNAEQSLEEEQRKRANLASPALACDGFDGW
jgi:hypothetical protein